MLTNAIFIERAVGMMSLVVMLANVAHDLQPHSALIRSTQAHLVSIKRGETRRICGTKMA
jgi:hypothetical protein